MCDFTQLEDCAINKHFIRRYIKFITYYINNEEVELFEKHHIYPSSLFPEYKNLRKFKWNKCNLPLRAHYLAHFMLAKACGGKMWFAFNQLSRLKKYIKYNSRLYEATRIHLREESSVLNTGREMSEELKLATSLRFKNTVNVRDTKGDTFNVSKEDERYVSGELVHYRVGYKHTIETIQKMKDNGISGKNAYSKNGVVRYSNETLGDGWEKGNTKHKGVPKAYLENTIWVTKDGKSTRLHKEEVTDEEIGRKFSNNGFLKIHNSTKVFNILEWKYKIVNNISSYDIKQGSAVNKMKLYCYMNHLFSNYDIFKKYCDENHIYAPERNFKLTDVKTPHFNMKNSTNLDGSDLRTLGYHWVDSCNFKNINIHDYIIHKGDI